MKRSLLLLLLIAAVCAQAQIAPNIYWVQFTDKNDSPYSIDIPEAYLSQRALDRRARLGISIDEYDIPVNPQYLQAVADCGAEILNPSKWLNGVSIRTSDPSVINAINALPFVSETRECPDNPEAQKRKEEWLAKEQEVTLPTRGMYDYYGGGSNQIHQIKGHVLHENGFNGEGIYIAILDGGFVGADTHPCFDNMREEGRLLGTRSFLPGHPSVYTQSQHGCCCLSTMAAYIPNTFVGTAPKASYYLIHTENGDYENIVEEYNFVSGLEFADSLGVDVCSVSLGYIDFDMENWSHPVSDFDGHTTPSAIGAEIGVSRGILCVIAAGNEGYPWNEGCTLGAPAEAEHVLTVGAVDGNGDRAWFSSTGPTADGRIKPDVMAQGSGTFVGDSDGSYFNGDGTSFATPVMAGAVACFRQANPTASVEEICETIRQTGNKANNPDNYCGYGIPDFELALSMLHVEDTFTSTNNIISVYPNPSKGEVHIALQEGYIAEVSVYDAMGRFLMRYHFNGLNHSTLENNLKDLADGLYFINAVSDFGSQTVKLIMGR